MSFLYFMYNPFVNPDDCGLFINVSKHIGHAITSEIVFLHNSYLWSLSFPSILKNNCLITCCFPAGLLIFF